MRLNGFMKGGIGVGGREFSIQTELRALSAGQLAIRLIRNCIRRLSISANTPGQGHLFNFFARNWAPLAICRK